MLRYGAAMYLKKVEAECEAERGAAELRKVAAELRELVDQQKDSAWAERTRKMKLLGTMVKSLQT